MIKIVLFFALIFHDFLSYFVLAAKRAKFRSMKVRISRRAVITIDSGCIFNVGKNVSVGDGTLLIAVSDPLSQETSASLFIGENTSINEYCNIRASGCQISIGDDCLFGQFATIIGSNHGIAPHSLIREQAWDATKTGINVGNDVWIGSHAVILPGVNIGNGAVIAAGAIVNRDVPSFEIWGGVPARKISSRL